MVEFISILGSFTALDISLMATNALLLVFSGAIFNKLSHGKSDSKSAKNRLHVFRAINVLIIALILFYGLLLPVSGASWVIKVVSVLSVIYLCHLAFYIANYFILSRFGRVREVDGQVRVGETYNTRALRILSAILFVVIALIGSIQILELNSLLQAGGVIGFFGVLLALTQASWAPDIISGLIILNSNLMEEGDVIQLDDNGRSFIGVVYKTKMFHTELLNIVNNHRVMIRNANIRDYAIHNLSRFASARGLRESLDFKIGYDVATSEINDMFNTAFEIAMEDPGIDIEKNHPMEVMTAAAGDHAVKWSIYYHTKDIRNLMVTRQQMIALVIKQAEESGIALATPTTHAVSMQPGHEAV